MDAIISYNPPQHIDAFSLYLWQYLYCGVRRALVGASGSSCCVELSRGLRLGGLAGSSPRLRRRLHFPGPRSVIFWTCPRSSPSLSAARSTASPTPEYSKTAFQVHRGGSNPLVLSLSLFLLRFPTPGVCPRLVPVRLSV